MTTHPQPVGTVVPDDKGPNQTDNSSGQRRERTMRTIHVTGKGQISTTAGTPWHCCGRTLKAQIPQSFREWLR